MKITSLILGITVSALSIQPPADVRELLDETQTCTPKTHVFFHKKHKSASSTLSAIMKDWSKKNRMKMAKTPVPAFLGGYPGSFNDTLVRGIPDDDGKFDVILHHLRFQEENLKKVLYDDTVYMTSMRSPLSHFVSAFEFFYKRFGDTKAMENRAKGESLICWGAPYKQILNNEIGKTANEFIAAVGENYDPNMPWHFRAKNFQGYELGFDTLLESTEEIQEAWEETDRRFDLIMITEYYWESLVLMKDLLCMSWIDLFIDSRTVGAYDKPTFTESEVAKFKDFNKLDEFIYQKSNSTFWERVQDRPGGMTKMEADVAKLKSLYAFCNDNVKECYDIKMSNKRPKRSAEVNEISAYDTRVELIDGIMEAMEHGYGSCDLGFYQRYNDANPGEREALANIDTL